MGMLGRDGGPLGVGWEAPESKGGVELLLGVKGWTSAAQVGAGVEGPWELQALAPSGQCETVFASLPKGWKTSSQHAQCQCLFC